MRSVSLASLIFGGDPALDDRYWVPIGSGPSAAGVQVTPDNALRVSAVYRCVSLLATKLADLPFHVYRKLERGRQEIPDHLALQLFAKPPNPHQTAFEFKRMMMGHLVLRSNCFARIFERGGKTELWPLHPDRVQGPDMTDNGRLRYKYTNPETGRQENLIRNIDIFALSGLSHDGLRGLALSDLAKETIGLALGAEQRAGQMMKDGVRFAGTVKIPGTMGTPAKEALSAQFRNMGASTVPVLESGMEFQQIGMTLEDAQFIEQRKFEISDIARWFGIPPHMIGDVERSTSWGTGIEHQSVQFVTYGLLPWIKLWEEAINDAFISQRSMYCRFNVAGLLRADTETRFEIYERGIQNGIFSPNDCREFEELNPRDGGDVYVDPSKANTQKQGVPAELPEPEPEESDDVEARIRLATQVKALAQRRASDLLGEESESLTKLGRQYARDRDGWRDAVTGFYARFCSRIYGTMACSKEAAKGWCETRRGMIMSDGLAKLTDAQQQEALSALTNLALANGAS